MIFVKDPIYLFESKSARERERESEADSTLSTELNGRLNPTTVRS